MAKPILEKIDVFVRDTFGFNNYRIPSICITKTGKILAACEARKWRSDWSCEAIVLRWSIDGGKTWSDQQNLVRSPVPITRNENLREAVNNPLFIVDNQNTIHFLYVKYYKRVFYMKSTDDGDSFSHPREITHVFEKFRERDGYDWNVVATGPGNGIQMKSGRLVVPIWIAYGQKHNHHPNNCGIIYSDDLGNTWRAGDLLSRQSWELFGDRNENQPIQLHDGRVALNIRTSNKSLRRAMSISEDGAHNWTEPEVIEEIFDPTCMASIARLSEKGVENQKKNRILFSNPTGGRSFWSKKPIKARKNMGVRLSYDECKTWPILKILEHNRSGYSDLAVSPTGEIFCLYERAFDGMRKKKTLYYDRISIAKFNLEWLTDSTDSL
jgi:sialidase-1